MLSWIFIVLAHWNNSPWIDMSPHSDTLSWFRANQSLLFLLDAAYGEATNSNSIVFGLTRLGLEPTIYRTQDQHANHYTTDAVLCYWILELFQQCGIFVFVFISWRQFFIEQSMKSCPFYIFTITLFTDIDITSLQISLKLYLVGQFLILL